MLLAGMNPVTRQMGVVRNAVTWKSIERILHRREIFSAVKPILKGSMKAAQAMTGIISIKIPPNPSSKSP
jgi:hypothetical protein